MNRKIVFFDIDGTIYSYDYGMPKDTFEAIVKLKLNGHIPVICTGRTKCMIYEGHMAPGFQHMIAGAGTYVEVDGKELYYSKLSKKQIEELSELMRRNGIIEIGEGKEHLYFGQGVEGLSGELKRVRDVYQKEMGSKIRRFGEDSMVLSKMSGFIGPDADLERAIEEGKNQYQIVSHRGVLLEYIPKGEGKANGMERMIQALGIDQKDTIAFGDSFNDKDMLEFADIAVVMGNGDPAIKKIADYVTNPFNKGGVSNALIKLGLI